ncbi:glycosyl transferase family 1 [Verrucomicrobiota bacterium]|nr:glycosyl transferase family 1 [Verrucomicrobiota bacterium]
MRVVHVITRLIVGGAQENTVATVFGLRALPGVEVSLISGPTTGPEGTLEPRFAAAPGLLTVIPELVRPVHPWHDVLAWRRLQQMFRAARPDIVHTHSGKAGVLGRLAARSARVPVIIHTIHGPSFGDFQGAIANQVFLTAEKLAARSTTHFTVVANAMTEQYLRAGIGQREQYTRIFSGFELAPFLQAENSPTLRARLGLAPDDFVIGKIARLFRLKGHDELFAIAPALVAAIPRLKFLFVGDGLWRQRFEEKARALGLERHFVFTGLVPPEEVSALIGIMDAVVHLSRREGLPRALTQALAAAKPIVAYDCDGAREVCLDHETGFLVAPGDLTTLRERLQQLAAAPALRARLGQRGQALVRDSFSVERMVTETHQLYQRLLAQHAPPAAG